jgi:iron-sulfur cluster repair protein YtfE (RIC family)
MANFEQSTEATTSTSNIFHFHRVDIYRWIHKALRLCMSTTLTRVGAMDHEDTDDVAETLAQVRELLAMCESHLDKENTYVHPAMEARRPSASAHIASEHIHHEAEIMELHRLVVAVELASAAECAEASHALYRMLSTFVGDNFLHMHVEETAHNAVLWSAYSDAELLSIEQTIVSSLTPMQKMGSMRWMLPALNAGERALLLGGVRDHTPPPVLDAFLGIARDCLSQRDYDKLEQQLGLQVRLAA